MHNFLSLFYLFLDEEAAKKDPKYHLARTNVETESTLRELDKTYKTPTEVHKKNYLFSCIYFMLRLVHEVR